MALSDRPFLVLGFPLFPLSLGTEVFLERLLGLPSEMLQNLTLLFLYLSPIQRWIFPFISALSLLRSLTYFPSLLVV